MKHQFRTLLAAAAFAGATAASSNVQAAGFMLNEVSARGNAMAGALVGDTGDASAVFYNPANMVGVPGSSVSAGFTMIRPRMDVRTLTAEGWKDSHNDIDWWPLPSIFYTRQLSEDWWVGLGVYVPFGLGSQFGSDWIGRYNNYDTTIKSFNINPSVAWQANDRLSFGAGLVVNVIQFQVQKKIPNSANPAQGDIDFFLDADWAVNVGGNVGMRYEILDNLQWGVAYRSPIHHNLEGKVRLSLDTPAGMKEFATIDATCDFDLPGLATTGFNYQPADRWNLGVSVGFTEWNYYDSLEIDFAQPISGRNRSSSYKGWSDVWRFAVGAEYQALDWLTLRCGYVFDEEPTHAEHLDYMVPANDRHLINTGVGIKLSESVSLDFGYTYLIIPDRDGIPGRPEDGFYPTEVKGKTHIASASVSWNF